MLGSSLGVANIVRFNKISAIEPGSYQVDVFVNGTFFSRPSIDFRSTEGSAVYHCLSDELLTAMGVLLPERGFDDDIPDEVLPESESFTERGFAKEPRWPPAALSAECVAPGERVPGATSDIDLSRLRLDVSVPQAMMKRVPRGFVDPASLDPGQTAGYVNYDTSFNHRPQSHRLPGRPDGAGVRGQRAGLHVHGAVFGGSRLASARPLTLQLYGRRSPADPAHAYAVRRIHL